MAGANELLAVARRELGNMESPANSNRTKYGRWFGLDGYAWCMMFVQWVFDQAGVALPRRTASCGELMRAAQAAGCWVTRDFLPGDVVIYDFPGGAATDHCGIVEMELPDYGVQAIEGNTSQSGSQSNGGMVCRKSRPRKYIIGAVRLQFEKEVQEDDMDVKKFKELWLEMREELQDNDSSEYSAEAREWAVRTGLVTGGDADTFNGMWEDVLTREQMVTVLYRFAKMAGLL